MVFGTGPHPNSLKTHCPRGHEYAGDNLIINERGARCCRICRKAAMARWSANNREGARAHGAKWRLRHPEGEREHSRIQKWGHSLAEVVARCGSDCALCGEPIDLTLVGRQSKAPSIDHIIPRRFGGTNDIENLQPAHIGCNSRKNMLGLMAVA